jgi:ketosteroid isomerase-like protein
VADAASSLARRFFALLEATDYGGLDAFLHPDVVFAPTMFPGRLYEGHDEVLRGFYELVFSLPAYRPEASTFNELTSEAVLVSGRIHFVYERGSLHDKSAFWVLTFSGGQLLSLRGKGSHAEALQLAVALTSSDRSGNAETR